MNKPPINFYKIISTDNKEETIEAIDRKETETEYLFLLSSGEERRFAKDKIKEIKHMGVKPFFLA